MKAKSTTNGASVMAGPLKVGVCLIAFAAATAAQSITFIANPANGHLYGLTDDSYRGIDKGGSIGDDPTVLDAEALAVSLGGHLVTINDADEQAWLLATFGSVASNNSSNLAVNFWIGLNDLEEEGTFRWFSGEPVDYIDWASTEPSNDRGEDVVLLDHPVNGPLGKWNDVGALMLGERSKVYRAMVEMGVAAPRPPNDNFADAVPIAFPQDNVTGVIGSNVGATREPGEPRHADNPGGASVWWKITPAQSGYLTLSTERSVSDWDGQSMDSLLTVYTGDALTELELVDWNDNDDETGQWWSWLRTPVSAGVEYYIAVDGYKGAFGPDHGQVVLDLHFSTTITFENAAAWQLPDLEGNTVQSADFANQVVLLNFWATWCPACSREIPELIELQEKYRNLGLAVVGISIDDPVGNELPIQRVSAYMQNFGINYPIVMTRPGGSSVESDFGLINDLGLLNWIPTSVIVDRKNRIVRRIAGLRDLRQWQQIVLPHLLDSIWLRASRADGSITLAWPTVPAEVQVQSSEQLPPVSWIPVVGTRTDDGQTTRLTLEDGSPALARFFRLRVDP